MSEVSLKRFYFALFDDGLTLKTLKWRLSVIEFKLLIHLFSPVFYGGSVLDYWVLGGLFLLSDLTGWPSFITKYKVQTNETQVNIKITKDKQWRIQAGCATGTPPPPKF